MKSATIADVRDHLSEILRQVEAGESVLIQRHGKVIAELRPANRATPSPEADALEARLANLEREGFLRRGTDPYPEWLEKPPPRGPEAGVLQALLDERNEGP